MLKIRLRRMGSRHRPFYRVVVSDSRRTPTAPALEEIGYYDPRQKPATLSLDVERVDHWMSHGAQPSSTVRKLVHKARSAAPAEKAGAEAAEDDKAAAAAEAETEKAETAEARDGEAAAAEEDKAAEDDKGAETAEARDGEAAAAEDDKAAETAEAKDEKAEAKDEKADDEATGAEARDESAGDDAEAEAKA